MRFDPVRTALTSTLSSRDGAAECVAVHAELASSLTLVAVVLLKNGHNKTLLEFSYCL